MLQSERPEMPPADLARAARALKRAHGRLLAGEPSFRSTAVQEQQVAALDAARARLRGGERPADGQMTLDVRGR